MLLRVPIADGQPAFAVVWSPLGFRTRPVAVHEAYNGGAAALAFERDEGGDVYEEPRLFAAEEVYDGRTEAEFVAACLNRLAKEEIDEAAGR